jgi:formylglycine-generating enzyme required for sulfatase activity
MKSKFKTLFIALAFLTGLNQAIPQTAQFFRIVGPAPTTISALQRDGTLVWTGAAPGTYEVQAATSLVGGGNWVDYVQLPITNNANTNLIVSFNPPPGLALIPAGSFTMGDSLSGDGDAIPTNIYVSGIYLDTNLVSYSQWQGVYTYATNLGYSFLNAGVGKAANHPVVEVDWFDCVKWSNARSQQAGLTPVYYTDSAYTQVFTNGDYGTPVFANFATNGYRLPTEAEWEKAARGGLIGQRFPWGDTISESQANYYANPNPPNLGGFTYDLGPYTGFNTNFDTGLDIYTSPVGYFAPNGYGLCDMAGNVFEWCWDWYGMPYGQPTNLNPTGVASGSDRVQRGGSWANVAAYSPCSFRSFYDPLSGEDDVGFRCALGL